jgi:hypothetical protein
MTSEQSSRPDPLEGQTVQVGILTKGRPMLATVIANLVLQEEHPIEIFIVDTGDQPSIKRVDVMSVLRLAQDRGIRCEYELHRDRQRAFSGGRLALLENLTGPLLAFMDDDIVLAGPIAALARRATELRPNLGWVAPHSCERGRGSRGSCAISRTIRPAGCSARTRSCATSCSSTTAPIATCSTPRDRASGSGSSSFSPSCFRRWAA